jgi:uncharacterized coiled-coil DUF342 family protein
MEIAMKSKIDISRLSAITQTRDNLQAAARKTNDAIDDLHRERCRIIQEIDILKSSHPGSLAAADEKQRTLNHLASHQDAISEQLKEARAIKDEADEKALAAVRLCEECENYARSV